MTLTIRQDVTYHLVPWQGSDFNRVRDAWDYLATVDLQAPVFNYREWFELGCEASALSLWGVLLIEKADRPVAVFPLRKRSPWSWEVASFFGNGDLQVLIDPLYEEMAWHELAAWIAHTPQVGYFSLGAVEQAARVELLVEACRQHGLFPHVKRCAATDVWAPLTATWEAFEQHIGRAAAKDLRRAERRMNDYYPEQTMEFLTDPEACREALAELMVLYRQRWGHRDLRCCFNDTSNVLFYQRAVDWAVRRGYGMISVLRVNGKPVALETLFRTSRRGTLYMHICARDAAMLPNRFSPGIVEAMHVFRRAIAEEMTSVNLGVLAMPYKMLFGGVEYPRWEVAVARSPLHQCALPALDRGLHIAHRLPVHTGYHLRKLWDRSRREVATP